MDGIVVIDKPAGWTSHDVVARVRRLLGEKRVGHTGTLDPFATGVLVVLVGRATRLAQFLAGAEKEYEAVIRFGYRTETGDLTGRPLQLSPEGDKRSLIWSEPEIEAALGSLRGEIEQLPPMYSAKKVGGRKLYELARRGIEIKREPVRVRVREFEIVRHGETGSTLSHNEDGTCDLAVHVVCSAGTYIRALAEALGEKLGAGAHLAALRRLRAGGFRLATALSLDQLQARVEAGEATKVLVSMDAALSGMPCLHLKDGEAQRVRHGVAVHLKAAPGWKEGEFVRMHDEQERLLAIGVYITEKEQVRPRILLASGEN